MKKLFTVALVLVAAHATWAQDVEVNVGQYAVVKTDEVKPEKTPYHARGKYFNMSYVQQKMFEPADDGTYNDFGKAEWGAAMTRGRTYFLHRKPAFGAAYFGLDLTWWDLNYAQYVNDKATTTDTGTPAGSQTATTTNGSTEALEVGKKLHQADISMFGIGPSLNIYPFNGKFGIHGYARINPTFSTWFSDFDNVMGGFGATWVAGGAISIGVFSLGLESRWGTVNYKDISGSIVDKVSNGIVNNYVPSELSDSVSKSNTEKPAKKLRQHATRMYLSFRF